jgi:hypothetical protein
MANVLIVGLILLTGNLLTFALTLPVNVKPVTIGPVINHAN